MHLPVNDVTALIPQKEPFVMVSKLLHVDDNLIRSSFVIKADNVLVKNGFFQESGLMENIAQTAALRAGYIAASQKNAVQNGYIGSVKNFEVFKLPQVNEEILTEVTIDSQIVNITILAGKVWLGDKLISQCEMRVLEGMNNHG